MTKHKKTREEKIKADSRRQSLSVQSEQKPINPTFSPQSYQFQTSPSHTPRTQGLAQTNTGIAHGLEKTLFVSTIIILVQLALFFLLTRHILILPLSAIRY